jgi:hypothetical protein
MDVPSSSNKAGQPIPHLGSPEFFGQGKFRWC